MELINLFVRGQRISPLSRGLATLNCCLSMSGVNPMPRTPYQADEENTVNIARRHFYKTYLFIYEF